MLCVEQHIKFNYLKFYCVMLMLIKCVEWIISLQEPVQSSLRGSKKGQAKVLVVLLKLSQNLIT